MLPSPRRDNERDAGLEIRLSRSADAHRQVLFISISVAFPEYDKVETCMKTKAQLILDKI